MSDNTKTKQHARPEMLEIATRAKDLFNRPWGGILKPNDDTLASRGGADGLKIYDALERDTTVYAALDKRKCSVIARPWQVDPASEDALDVRAAEIVKTALDNITFDDACYQLLDAILKGFSVSEIMWDNRDGATTVAALIPRDQRRFTFAEDGSLRLLTAAQPFHGEELPPRKFIVHSMGSKDGNPFGLGLGTRLFWPVWFKREGMEFWLTFADKYGTPTAVGKYPITAQEGERQNLLRSLSRIAQDSAIVIPEDTIIDLLEASRGGAGDTYERLLRYCDEMILQAVLGEAQSVRESGGALAAASIIRNEVRLEKTRSDGDLLSSTINKTLIQWLVEFNIPAARPPKVWRNFDEQEDLNSRSERDERIARMANLKPTLDYIVKTYGGEWEETREETPTSSDAPASAPTFAATDELDNGRDAVFNTLLLSLPPVALNAQSEQMLKPVIDLIMAGDDYEAALAALDQALPLIDTDALATALGNAMFVAETYGRIEARREAQTD
jgi:phage gp29-like protein